MRSVILSQWRERRIGVIWHDLEACITVWAREFWMCWRRDNWDLEMEFIVERITVIKFGVNDTGSSDTGSWRIKVRPDTAKFTNVIATGFGERCNMVREGKMFVKDEAEISSRVGVVYFGKLVFESDEQEFRLRGVKSKKISSHPGRDVLKSVLKVRNAWGKVEWVEREEELSIICIKVVVEGKRRDKEYSEV